MKKYTFYLVGLVVLALSSCNKNKLYYPADFYQGTMQTCIDKNNIYVDIHRTFPHINTNSIFYYDNFPAEHLIEYNFDELLSLAEEIKRMLIASLNTAKENK